ncbi:MAG: cytochrome C [Gammaproteobacteria bacterium]|nr:cytochrome C [Gammaproteobacteria bacterium]MDH5487820.1 cytochrome C [Gammaproteobacteria bacterium]
MTMRSSGLVTWIMVGLVCLASAWSLGGAAAQAAESNATQAAERPENAMCLGCHGNEGFAMPGADGKPRPLHVNKDKFGKSVHGKRACVECHKDINEIPHQNIGKHKVSCVQCHETLWETAQKENKTQEFAKLGAVVKQIDKYMHSIHARPNREDQSRTNATCYNCHDAHYVYPVGSTVRAEWRLDIPNICGKCHSKEREEYVKSVHGDEVIWKHNPKAAICSDCHTTHDIDSPEMASIRLVITKNCGNCHKESYKSYTGTYHGQVQTLGFAYTAKCFDCHGNHGIQRTHDPKSTVHPDNRLNTCQKCHVGATAGFVTFEPHGNTRDYDRYPFMWIASKFMIALLFGVFAFFWTHSALWFYREYRERAQRKSRPHVVTDELLPEQGKHFQRFRPLWRLAHLVFAISVMMLVLTGMAVLFAEAAWAKAIINAFGSPKITAIVHRTSATIMLGIFFAHLVYLGFRINWKTFQWFGPNSLVPSWQDFRDFIAMFKWFFGHGPRPAFDRWTYWEKFDYWAVFWGMAIIGGSGFMLWFPNLTASLLPGWAFNVATLVHGEEAILAAVFLFTVHFFNNHFRPDKHPPPDLVMFTGAVSLEEFKREHTLEYNRLVASGELEKYLVDAPSRPMTLSSRILGITLIVIGLILLALVLIGFMGSMTANG